MENVVVEIELAATEERIEAVLPVDRPLRELLNELIPQIELSRNNITFDMNDVVVCDKDRGILLNLGCTIREAGVSSGSRILLC